MRHLVKPKLQYASTAWDPYYKKTKHPLNGSKERQPVFVRTASVTNMSGTLSSNIEKECKTDNNV